MKYDDENAQELEELGERTARSIKPAGRGRGRGDAARLRRELREIRAVCGGITEKRSRGDSFTVWDEWLTDNFYLASLQGSSAAEELDSAPLLPSDKDGIGVVRLCEKYAAARKGQVDADSLRRFMTRCVSVESNV